MRSWWSRVKEFVKGKVVYEMWTYLYRNNRAFYKWVFTCYVFRSLGVYLIYSVGDRDENTFGEVKMYLPDDDG
ncbi:hypothetical protein Stok01_01211 [Sulfurisphaera tokodaii]